MENIEVQVKKALDFLKKEYATLQTGRANAKLIEDLEVEIWGARQPIKHIANISVPDAQSIVIDPWDKNNLQIMEREFQKNPNFGFGINSNGVILRLTVAALTEERRKEIVKVVHQMAEKAKIAIRNARHEIHAALKKQKEIGEISEDVFYGEEKELQNVVDGANKDIDEHAKKKEAEVMMI